MRRAQVRWSIALLAIFALVIAACQPSPTPTPTPRPPTEIPTVAPTEEVTEAPTTAVETEAATMEATSMMTEEATSAAMMTSEATMMATEEATSMMMTTEATSEVAMAPTMMMTEMPTSEMMMSPEATSMMMTEMPTSEMMMSPEATSMMMTEEPTSEMMMSPEATSMMMTEMPTSEMMMSPEATSMMTEMATSEVAMAPTMMMTEMPTSEMMMSPEATSMMTMEPTEAMTEMATMEATMEMTEMATMEATSEMMSTPEATMEMTPMVTMEATGPAGVAAGSTVTVAADGQVVIGLATGLSGEGIAPLGIDIQRGAEIALADRPSVTVDGKTFTVKLDVQDDQCSADGGQAVGNRFASDGTIVGVVGPMCSSACRAAAPIFDAAKFTTISPSCTAPDLTTSGLTSFNRDATSDAFQGKIAASFIYNNLGLRKIATIHDGSPYGEGLVAVVTENFTALGGEVVDAEAVTVGDTDFRSLLEDIAAKSPDLIYFGGFPAEAARLIQQRADTGLDKTIFMGADGINGTEVVNLAGTSAEGVYASKGIPTSSAGLATFLAKYKSTYGEDPTAPFHSNAYDAINILMDAVEKTGTVDASGNLVVDRAKIADYVRSIKNYNGLTGTLNADGTGETAISDIGIAKVENGAFQDIAVGKTNADGTISISDVMAATPEATMSAMSTEMATMEATAEATP